MKNPALLRGLKRARLDSNQRPSRSLLSMLYQLSYERLALRPLTFASSPSMVGCADSFPSTHPVCQLARRTRSFPRSGRFANNGFTRDLLATGTRPIAVSAPCQGASGSRIAMCPTAARRSLVSISRSTASLGTDSTTALVPSGRSPGLDSPAAWTTCAARNPSGRSLRTMT
jgi:hypothetical protein